MKLSPRLLVAPAVLGLIAPLAVVNSPAAHATELNINGVSDYAATTSGNSLDQVTSVTQFSDVDSTDWAYQALANLVETYGCVAGYPNGVFRGNRAMTRYEAAALLHACLDRITEVTDKLRRLIEEFETELAMLQARVDGLEADVGALKSAQFSTTTKLSAQTAWVAGATHAKGDNYNFGGEKGARSAYNAEYGGFSFSYDLRLGLKTSFSGKDLLFTRLRVGSIGASNVWGGNGVSMNKLDFAGPGGSIVKIDRLYYRFPLGDSFTIQVGPLTQNNDMMGYKPTAYASGGTKILDFFGGSMGTPGVWNKEAGGGFGAIYSNKQQVEKGSPYFTVAANYVADAVEAYDSNPNTGGFMTDNSEGNITTQIAYGNKQWGLAAGYRYGQCGSKLRTGTEYAVGDAFGIPCTLADGERTNAYSQSWSAHGFWRPEDSGWMPSISLGVGKSYLNGNDAWEKSTNKRAMASWMLGLTWNDVVLQGNALGYAVGQPQFVTPGVWNKYDVKDDFVADGGYAMELWYSFQVTDNIQITPAVYWLSRPFGNDTQNVNGDYESLGVLGGLVLTTFKF